MKSHLIAPLAVLIIASSAQAAPSLTVTAEGITQTGYIQPEYAFCAPAPKGHVQGGEDKSIGLSWSKGPEGTKSYAIIAVDPDVPTVFDTANKEGKIVSASLPRRDFYHWILVNIPADVTDIPAGKDSNGASKNGKSELEMPYGLRGINDYAGYMASDPEHKGVYAGYDGPCPPWNDGRVHHYHFKVFALDVKKLPVKKPLTGQTALKLIAGHILAQGEVVGLYTLNPALAK